jgi:putative transposase
MPRKRHKLEEIVTKLRQIDVLVSQGQGIADAIRQIGVSEVAYVTNCSTARSSKRCEKLRSSAKAGGITTTPSAGMPLSATGHLHQKSSCRHYRRGRLRADRLRRPRWRYRHL